MRYKVMAGTSKILSQNAGTGGTNFHIGMALGINIIRVGYSWGNSSIPFPLDGK